MRVLTAATRQRTYPNSKMSSISTNQSGPVPTDWEMNVRFKPHGWSDPLLDQLCSRHVVERYVDGQWVNDEEEDDKWNGQSESACP